MANLDGLDALINKQFAARPQRKKKSFDDSKRDIFWMTAEKTTLRLLPYIHEDDTLDFNPFKLFHIHYGKNQNNPNAPLDKMRVSPMTWDEQDVLVDYCERIIDQNFELARALQPSPNYHVPVLLYDENGENPQVCFWSMNPTTFEQVVELYKDPEYGSLHDEENGLRLTVYKKRSNGKTNFIVQPSRKSYPLTDAEKQVMQDMKKFEDAYTLPKEGELEDALVRFVKKHFGGEEAGDSIEYSASTPEKNVEVDVTPPVEESSSDADDFTDDLDALLS